MTDPFTVLIMAAGQGTRMRSEVPKVLHRICGKPMVEWVIDAATEAGASRVVCVVRPGDGVEEGLPEGVEVAEQHDGEGTGAAVLAARDAIESGPFIVLSGDHPLVTPDQISRLLEAHRQADATATLLTTELQEPAGYGRIVRDGQGQFERIVETKDAEQVSADELAIREINLGTYVFEAPALFDGLERVANQNGERFLTGAFPLLKAEGLQIVTCRTDDLDIAHGVNDRAGLMEAEELAQRRILEQHARAGVTFLHPGTARVEAGVTIGVDTVVDLGVSLLGDTAIGSGATVGPHTTARDSRIGDRASVVHSFLVEVEVQDNAKIGPFAYLRPGTIVRHNAKVGTFVEVKNSDVGEGAKVPHLSYIGDADVGEGSNIGASTITANYDGRRKHRTKLGKSVKTGIHTSLVAPVDVGDRAYTGAGSTITDDVPEGALGIARSKQSNIEGYSDRVEEDSQ
ncbi:MAG: bifunctional UDP-N-acetylglucosamine pyrophosphorylase / glucosamine-phosphate N-acetyltransferase [Thermoleophilaceae bacterium]|nr:bifunctional UDP-N-acetylglucosamine pyrophosphorylase / glucosamine-phosphate N-acetyltransferase [Thermoleophilaceae bacterium]